ncbi:hypothetical protein FD28_GL001787 [Levilactobacillus hammesii DSM 16381]|uniref:Uncharacterized protein n=1 Tax=Levilactobacillus hammesii DSM 16381 TaxID=1423753 RepID=A0A0R1UV26_9LACO|nr:hypothetical protein FD28_GL001787 [Levilactobacillus hammesii DSM 16381]
MGLSRGIFQVGYLEMATLKRWFFRFKAREKTAPQASPVLPTAFQSKFGEQ